MNPLRMLLKNPWSAVGALLLLAGALSAVLVQYAQPGWWDAHRREGYTLTEAEVEALYPQVPDAENAALDYLRAANRVTHFADGETAFQENLPVAGGAELPEPNAPIPPQMARSIREYAKRNERALDWACRGAAKTRVRFPVDVVNAPMDVTEHLSQVRELARLLYVDALRYALNNQPSHAADALMAMCALSDALSREPLLISQLVRVALAGITADAIEQTVNRVALPPEALRKLEQRLDAPDFQTFDPMHAAVRNEFRWGVAWAEGQFADEQGNAGSHWLAFRLLHLSGWTVFNETLKDRGMKVVLAAGEMPPHQAIGAMQELDYNDIRATVAGLLLNALPRLYEGQVRCIAIASLARCLNRAHGGFPESLDPITPAFIEAVPADPYTGEPLRYKRTDKGCVVFSAGPNGQYEGGQARPDGSRYRQEGDMVFRLYAGIAEEPR